MHRLDLTIMNRHENLPAFCERPRGENVAGVFSVRVPAALTFVLLLAAAPVFSQSTATSHPYGLDPYKPSDAEWLRNYGAALVAQTPLLELRALDPYKPSDANLLRQIGGAIPLCCPDLLWPGPALGPFTSSPSHDTSLGKAIRKASGERGSDMAVPISQSGGSQAADVVSSEPTAMSTPIGPQTNDGVWLNFNGQVWISAGRAVPLVSSEFQRVGEYGRVPVYKLIGGSDDLIYVPSREGLVAPYRRKR